MIHEALMGPGTFDFTLRPDTPLAVRKSIPYWVPSGVRQMPFPHVFVTRQRLAQQILTTSRVIAQSQFTGRISSRSNQMHTYGGNGLGVWLGDANGIGPGVIDNSGPHTWTWQQWVTNTLPPTGTIYTSGAGGITMGSFFSPFTTTWTGSAPNLQMRNLYDNVSQITGNQWRVTPQGVFESGDPASLFRGAPTAIVVRDVSGIETGMAGLQATSLEVDENFDGYAKQTRITGSGVGVVATSTSFLPNLYGFDGTTSTPTITSQSSSTTTTAGCLAEAETFEAKWSKSQSHITCQVNTYNVRQYVEPGDNIFMYDPETGLVDLTATSLTFRGRALNPATVKVQGVVWPIRAGMGLYVIQSQDGTNTVVDLSDWFQPETQDAELVIGARALTAREVSSGARPFF